MPAEQCPPGNDEPDFFDTAYDEPAYDDRRYPLSTALMACFLLLVFFCGTAVPAATLLFWWLSDRAEEHPATRLMGRWYREPDRDAQPAIGGEHAAVNRIAFINLQGQLATVRPDGSDARQLTHHNNHFFFPAWSPDGSRLAVLGADGESGSLFTVSDSSSSVLQELYHSRSQAPFYIYWSPDSDQVTFLANNEGSLALFLAQADQPAATRLLATGQPFYWDWSPGSDQLLIHSGIAGHDSRLTFIDLQGNSHSRGRELARPGFFQAPGFSRSGRYWAYAELDAAANRQLVVENDSGDRRLSLPHLGQVALSWSPTDERLAFTSPLIAAPAFYGPLRLLEPVTGENRLLTPELVVAFFWSPDGRQIAFLTLGSGRHDNSVRASFRTGSTAPGQRVLPAPTGQNRNSLLLDLWVVAVDEGEAYRLITFQPTELFVTQFLPFFDQYALSHQIWSPASDALVMPMSDANGIPRIHVVPIDGRPSIPIVDGAIAFWSRQ